MAKGKDLRPYLVLTERGDKQRAPWPRAEKKGIRPYLFVEEITGHR